MPQELLRDVLRPGDATGRARRRVFMLPASIVAHAVAVAAIVIIPLAADVDLPPPMQAPMLVRWVETAPPPPPPYRPLVAATVPTAAAPTHAPTSIAPETERRVLSTNDVIPPGAVPSESGFPTGVGLLGPEVGTAPPPPPPPPVQRPTGPIRITNGLKPPTKVFHVDPVYPVMAREAHIEGTVVLEATIDETGRIDRLKVLRSAPLLDAAALDAVRQWRYTPTLLNGVRVPVLLTITVSFRLN